MRYVMHDSRSRSDNNITTNTDSRTNAGASADVGCCAHSDAACEMNTRPKAYEIT